MKETLLQRCQRLAPNNRGELINLTANPECDPTLIFTFDEVKDIIANTLKQAAEEFIQLLDRYEIITTGEDSYPTGNVSKKHVLAALTEAQRLLLGEDNENV